MRKKIWVFLAMIALAVGGVYAYRTYSDRQAATAVNTQTATITIGSVEAKINGVGTVRSKQSASVSWQTSGKVAEVNVQIGQQVQAGAILATLDQSSLSTNIIQAQADLISAQNDLEDLQQPDPLKIAEAEKALAQAQTSLANLLNPSEIVILQAEQAVTDAQDAVDDAQKAVDKLARGRGNQEQIELARAKYLIAQANVDRMQEVFDKTPGVVEEDADKAMALSNLANAKTARDQALASLNWYLGKPSEAEIAAANFNLSLAQAKLVNAQDTLASLQSPTLEDIALAQATVDAAQKALDTARAGASEEELIIAQTRVTVAQATLDQARLVAPFAGMITDQDVLPGDLVTQGRVAFQVHDFSLLFVDLSISEMDISQVQVGQDAVLTFDAIDVKEYSGKVVKIGLSATVSQGVVNYPVTVHITNPDEDILPGMTAAVVVVVEKHENVMVVPNQAIRTLNSQRTVTVLFEGQQISVPVTVGLTSDSVSEVTSSQLRAGDTVVVTGASTTATTGSFIRGGMDPGSGFEIGPGGGMIP